MKNLILFLICFPIISYADVDLITLDDWNILSTSEHNLFISKQGEKNKETFLGFHMDRPFCICSNPVFNLKILNSVTEGELISASIRVDLGKTKAIDFQVLSKPDSLDRVFLRPFGFPSLSASKVIEVESSTLFPELFLTSGIQHAMEASKEICESEFYLEDVEKEKTAFEMEV